jgi:hypothetical protein
MEVMAAVNSSALALALALGNYWNAIIMAVWRQYPTVRL